MKIKVSEYIEMNKKDGIKISRKDVYKLIYDGTLKAEKDARGTWVIDLPDKEEKRYTVSEFVEEYNKKHKKDQVDVKEVRKLLSDGKIKGYKKSGKWIVTQCARRLIKR